MSAKRILVVGTSAESRLLAELLQFQGYDVVSTEPEQVARAIGLQPDVILADAAIPTVEGALLLGRLAGAAPRPPVILISARPSRALESLGVKCLSKPVDLRCLEQLIGEPTRMAPT